MPNPIAIQHEPTLADAMCLWEAYLEIVNSADDGEIAAAMRQTREVHGTCTMRDAIAALLPSCNALFTELGIDHPFDWEHCPLFLSQHVDWDSTGTNLPAPKRQDNQPALPRVMVDISGGLVQTVVADIAIQLIIVDTDEGGLHQRRIPMPGDITEVGTIDTWDEDVIVDPAYLDRLALATEAEPLEENFDLSADQICANFEASIVAILAKHGDQIRSIAASLTDRDHGRISDALPQIGSHFCEMGSRDHRTVNQWVHEHIEQSSTERQVAAVFALFGEDTGPSHFEASRLLESGR